MTLILTDFVSFAGLVRLWLPTPAQREFVTLADAEVGGGVRERGGAQILPAALRLGEPLRPDSPVDMPGGRLAHPVPAYGYRREEPDGGSPGLTLPAWPSVTGGGVAMRRGTGTAAVPNSKSNCPPGFGREARRGGPGGY